MQSSVAPRELGFTLVEVMVAIFVLLVGVLGVVALSDGAARSTDVTKAREEGTNVARDEIEATHTFQYTGVTQASIYAQLQAQTGLADDDPAAAGWQLKRRGIVYAATVSVCTFDDPKDGLGAHDSSYCSDVGAASTADANSSDYKRLTVNVAWVDPNGTEQVNQATLLRNNSRGPAIATLNTSPTAGIATVTSASSVGFSLTTSLTPARVQWYVDGSYQGDLNSGISGSGTGPYTFTWNLNGACATNSVQDGTYFVAVQAFDATDTSPGQRSLTMNVNRCAPVAPANILGGRNRWGVELNWDDNPEDDVVGYYVYRGIAGATPTQIASGPCGGLVTTSTCIEPDPASSSSLVYYVKAVDRDPSANLRAGGASASLSVTTTNRAPNAPTIGSCGTSPCTIGWYATTDPDSGDSVDYYRIYRDGQAFANRYDVIDNVGSPVVWTEPNAGGTTHTYYVVAVDTHAKESAFSNGVTR
ncbi:MAG TPA: prepilin-type N-terminal cleavage/methylation domain-containing protein [Thermoleophilaceae bacterium]